MALFTVVANPLLQTYIAFAVKKADTSEPSGYQTIIRTFTPAYYEKYKTTNQTYQQYVSVKENAMKQSGYEDYSPAMIDNIEILDIGTTGIGLPQIPLLPQSAQEGVDVVYVKGLVGLSIQPAHPDILPVSLPVVYQNTVPPMPIGTNANGIKFPSSVETLLQQEQQQGQQQQSQPAVQ